MAHCPSCGGIIGRDCFNPVECAQITASMQNNNYELELQIDRLEREIIMLRDFIKSNGLEIPLDIEPINVEGTSDFIDGLPF